ncbi:hypothetical protein L1049_002823 [Liquidambar formosana]|uniref:Uncharacterized protein n=1 Tax=Liquidambar formosana TaxID=63359 RepID=A0AAP0NIT0_LIQFO
MENEHIRKKFEVGRSPNMWTPLLSMLHPQDERCLCGMEIFLIVRRPPNVLTWCWQTLA